MDDCELGTQIGSIHIFQRKTQPPCPTCPPNSGSRAHLTCVVSFAFHPVDLAASMLGPYVLTSREEPTSPLNNSFTARPHLPLLLNRTIVCMRSPSKQRKKLSDGQRRHRRREHRTVLGNRPRRSRQPMAVATETAPLGHGVAQPLPPRRQIAGVGLGLGIVIMRGEVGGRTPKNKSEQSSRCDGCIGWKGGQREVMLPRCFPC